jgi:gamma-butyrobetaine dioxygenase
VKNDMPPRAQSLNPRLDALFDAFDRLGSEPYGEEVSQVSHMLQTAALAVADGAPDALVAAALLHDVGHFAAPANAAEPAPHEALGVEWLRPLFGPEVWRPVGLHVAAKRYLCAVSPGYLEQLSEASQQSLVVQGGPFTPAQAERFIAAPYAQDAVRLRLYDDAAKIPGGSARWASGPSCRPSASFNLSQALHEVRCAKLCSSWKPRG